MPCPALPFCHEVLSRRLLEESGHEGRAAIYHHRVSRARKPDRTWQPMRRIPIIYGAVPCVSRPMQGTSGTKEGHNNQGKTGRRFHPEWILSRIAGYASQSQPERNFGELCGRPDGWWPPHPWGAGSLHKLNGLNRRWQKADERGEWATRKLSGKCRKGVQGGSFFRHSLLFGSYVQRFRVLVWFFI